MTKHISYKTALRRSLTLADFERSTHNPDHSSYHLERITLLMKQLGNRHLEIPTIHIAGTKGKGSTAAMVTSILTAHGFKTGLFTSPHLHHAVERIRIGMKPISRTAFATIVEQIWPAVERIGTYGPYGGITWFEMMLAVAFVHFHESRVSFQVMEVGLGGRLDATNIVKPNICAITSISLDHTSTLGETLEQIAYEKAGIIKTRVPIVAAPQSHEVLNILKDIAQRRNAPLVNVRANMKWSRTSSNQRGQNVAMHGNLYRYEFRSPLLGDYQLENAATAISIIEALVPSGFPIDKRLVETGLQRVKWPARLEVISSIGPQLVVDGAHNPYSIGRLVKAVRELFIFKHLFIVFGSLTGHSIEGMVQELVDLSATMLIVESRHPRAAPMKSVASVAATFGVYVGHSATSVAEGLRKAFDMAEDKDLILGTGSLSVAAEIIEEMKGLKPELYPGIAGNDRPR